jgi:hypothetical protein
LADSGLTSEEQALQTTAWHRFVEIKLPFMTACDHCTKLIWNMSAMKCGTSMRNRR